MSLQEELLLCTKVVFLVFNRPGAIAGVQAGRSHKHSYRGIDLTAGGIASITPWRTTLEGGNATQLLGPNLDGTYTDSQPHMESDLSVYRQLGTSILWGYSLPMSCLTEGCEPTSRFTSRFTRSGKHVHSNGVTPAQ